MLHAFRSLILGGQQINHRQAGTADSTAAAAAAADSAGALPPARVLCERPCFKATPAKKPWLDLSWLAQIQPSRCRCNRKRSKERESKKGNRRSLAKRRFSPSLYRFAASSQGIQIRARHWNCAFGLANKHANKYNPTAR